MKTSNHISQKMNRLILITIFALFSVLKIAASNEPVATFKGKIYASGMNFTPEMSNSKWSNATTNASAKARYSKFNGETFVNLISYDKQAEIVLEAKVKVAKGKLCLIVENSAGEIIYEKSFREDETASATLTLDVYEPYKIRFIGENAKGSYACEWTQK